MASLEKIPSDAIRVLPQNLRKISSEIFRKLGLPDSDAKQISNYLVQVDLRGVVSHGTRQIHRYSKEYRTNSLNPTPLISLIQETPVTAIFDGDGGIGYLVASRATETVIQKAKAHGIAAVSTQNHGHVGSEGIYARMALPHDLVTLSVAGSANWQAPTEKNSTIWDAMHSPPICFAIPSDKGPPFVLDMAANMFRQPDQLELAMEKFPEAIIKSLGLKFLSTLLGGILTSEPSPDKFRTIFPAASRGFFIIAFRIDHFGEPNHFKEEVSRIISESLNLKPILGQATTEVPGSREWKREQDWSKEGIPISKEHRKLLEEIAFDLEVDITW